MNQLQTNSPRPTEEYRCRHCKESAIEFDIHNISRTDNYGNQVNQRWRKEVHCGQCGAIATVVKLDPNQAMREEQQRQQFPNSPHLPELTNPTFVQEPQTDRPKPYSLKEVFGPQNRHAANLSNKGGLTPIDEFKKKFSGF